MSHRDVTSPDAFDRAQRRADAVKLRAQGMTLREIAAQLGVAVGTVHADIQRALEDVPAEAVGTLRAVWGDRLDQGVRLVMDQIKAGNLDAVDKLVRLTDRAAKLYGLDAPRQVEMMGATDLDLDAALREYRDSIIASMSPRGPEPIRDYSDDEINQDQED